MDKQSVIQIIKGYLQTWFTHNHNGTNSLRIKASDIVGLSTGGTSTPTPPGGNDLDIQYNKAGVFGGDDNLTWDYNNQILDVEGVIQTSSQSMEIDALNSHTMTIQTEASATAPSSSGAMTIKTGDANYTSGSSHPVSGNITIKTGFSQNGNAGNILIEAGNTTGHRDGGITLETLGSEGDSAGGIVILANSGSIFAQGNDNGVQITTKNGVSGSTPSGSIGITTGDAASGPASGGIALTTGIPGGTLGNPVAGGDITLYTQSDSHNNDAGNILIEYNQNNK